MVFIPIIYTCCFTCSTKLVKAQVDSLLESLPADAWPACRDRMLMPVLRRLSAMDSKGACRSDGWIPPSLCRRARLGRRSVSLRSARGTGSCAGWRGPTAGAT